MMLPRVACESLVLGKHPSHPTSGQYQKPVECLKLVMGRCSTLTEHLLVQLGFAQQNRYVVLASVNSLLSPWLIEEALLSSRLGSGRVVEMLTAIDPYMTWYSMWLGLQLALTLWS